MPTDPLPSSAARRSPVFLWHEANREHPNDAEARRRRYLELMREHGHLVPKEQDHGE